MTIEEYCSKLNVTKEALSDKQIEEWGLKYYLGLPFQEIFDYGTKTDKKNAINAMRTVINRGGRFMYSSPGDEGIQYASPIDMNNSKKGNEPQNGIFKIWVENYL